MSDAASQSISAGKRWAFRLIALIGVPVLFLLLLEGGLRIGGYGFDASYLREVKVGDRTELRDNPAFFRLFFPKHLLPVQLPFSLITPKPEGRVRVLLLGGSAAMGIPEPAYGMGPMLEVMLRERHPGVDFEVLNLGNTAINSHVVSEIAQSVAPLEPDMLVVYLGNNEVVGPFGAGTVFTPLAPSPGFIRASLAVRRTRTGQLMSALSGRFAAKQNTPTRWRGMEMFLEQQVPFDSPGLPRVYSNFEHNLEAICAAGRELGVPVVLSSVGVNLRHCGPFASVEPERLGEEAAARFQAAVARGDSALTRVEMETAREHYESALEIDEESADMHYRVGRLLLMEDQIEAAREHLLMARELDTLRFRADLGIHERIVKVAGRHAGDGVFFAAAVESLEVVATAGLPGRESLWEHVHLDHEGNHRVALALLQAAEAALGEKFAGQREPDIHPTSQQVATALGFTPYQRGALTRQVGQLLLRPPFSHQIDHAEQMQRLEADFRRIEAAYPPGSTRGFWPVIEAATQRRPDDWIRVYRAADFLTEAVGDHSLAEPMWRELTQKLPHFPAAWNSLAKCVARQEREPEAIKHLERSLELNPYQPDMLTNLARMKKTAGDIRAARALYERALEFDPENPALQEQLKRLGPG